MYEQVTDYFDGTILPLIRDNHPAAYAGMSILILGSVGLGIDDALSDIEADVYLDEPLWRTHGAALQLDLNRCLAATNRWQPKGSLLCVHPQSWLLDGQAAAFLAQGEPSWQDVSLETLFTMQHNHIYFDPAGTLARLRNRTAADRYPVWLWQKKLLEALQQLICEDFADFKRSVQRGRQAQVQLLLGPVLQGLLQTAFLMERRYYPWRTHLRWALGSLRRGEHVAAALDAILAAPNPADQVAGIAGLLDDYRQYIAESGLLGGVDVNSANLDEELLWAQRFKAWENPAWRRRLCALRAQARQSGYPEEDFWVWSLWGTVNLPQDASRREKPSE